MEGALTHLDCRNYAPVDVAKGICHLSKETILADGQSCEKLDRLPKCKHCRHYAPGEEAHIGTCQASESSPMTYPELIVVTCEDFAWREA